MTDSYRPLRAAVIDLYDNKPNEGMRAIGELLTAADGRYHGVPVKKEVFVTRFKEELPTLDHDVYISSGGPGSPFDGQGTAWEAGYFRWLDAVWNHNARVAPEERKHVLFICHSFQMMVRHFGLAEVTERHSQSFGILPVHKTKAGKRELLFDGLADPFFAADFRHWQVTQPNHARLDELGAKVLALEKIRPYVDRERATMAIRLTPELIRVQFHPEADPAGMIRHFRQDERKAFIIEHHGEAKYERILHRIEDPDFLTPTHDTVVPTFLRNAVETLRPAQVARRRVA